MNGQYIKKMDNDELRELMKKHLGNKYNGIVKKSVKMIKERINKLDELEEFDFLYDEPKINEEMIVWKKGTVKSAKEALEYVEELLSAYEPGIFGEIWNKFWERNVFNGLRNKLDSLAKRKFDGDRGTVYWPFRVALSGRKFSPDPIDILQSIGKEKALIRIKRAIEKLAA